MKSPVKIKTSILASVIFSLVCFNSFSQVNTGVSPQRVGVLLVDTERQPGKINESVYGHFLEHINHSVVDGLFAEQVRGQGFEGDDFKTYWEIPGQANLVSITGNDPGNGKSCLQLKTGKGKSAVSQDRFFFEPGKEYLGSLFTQSADGSVRAVVKILDNSGGLIKQISPARPGKSWQKSEFSFTVPDRITNAKIEIEAKGNGTLLIDFISVMSAETKAAGPFRPDLFKALDGLNPPFIRWPGGSYATIYKWKEGIGNRESRIYNPNTFWGGYSDYYGFGTDEFMELCRQLGSEPLIVLPATGTSTEEIKYAMDWIHYLNDGPETEWGKIRAANGHPGPYGVKYFQIDNEPMNNGFTPESYAEIVNIYGSAIRAIDPSLIIVACGQKRSNDLNWSQKVIDIAGQNFDILGCHNYEYEDENFQTGITRIGNYLEELISYIGRSKYPDIKPAVLEWGLCRTYDWKAGLHTAGSLMLYERLGDHIEMTCPALLMRNTTDDPTWTAFIYHDHVTWFPGAGYVIEKLFHQNYAPNLVATATGTYSDIANRNVFFEDISQMKPEDWQPGTIDAVATMTEDRQWIIIKAVNYEGKNNTLLAKIKGAIVDKNTDAALYTVSANISAKASIEDPDAIKVIEKKIPCSENIELVMEPYSVIVLKIKTTGE